MQKKKESYKYSIPAFYRRSTLDVMLFTHVTAMRFRMDLSLEEAIEDFIKMYDISHDDYPIDSALVTYNRVMNNFIYVNKVEEK